MLLRHLFEARGNEVAIIFGRFNPPHKGHRAAWEMASESPAWFVGTNESTVGPKDPLPFDVKVEAMKTVWPEVKGHIMAETSWLTMASEIYKKYPKATLLCLTDEDWVTKTIIQYNGKEGAHGFYNFPRIEQKATPRLSSATALRDAVARGDRDAFSQAAGVSADTKVAGKPFFDLVAEYLMPYQNAPKKVAKKKKEPEVTEVAVAGETIPTTEFVKGIYSLAAEYGSEAPNPEAVKKMMVLAPNQEVDVQKTFQKIIATFQAQLPKIKQMMAELDALIKQAEEQGVQEGDLIPWPNGTVKVDVSDVYDWYKLGQHISNLKGLGKHDFNQGPPQTVISFGSEPLEHKYLKYLKKIGLKTHDIDENVTDGKNTKVRSNSPAMSQTAKRLTDPKDGAVAKLRAAGDKRREEHLKGRNISKKNENVDLKSSLQELSNDMLGRYKKAAGSDASKADKEGDFKRGDKRFSGIVTATKKQFGNDAKKNK